MVAQLVTVDSTSQLTDNANKLKMDAWDMKEVDVLTVSPIINSKVGFVRFKDALSMEKICVLNAKIIMN